MRERISVATARRIALAATGLAEARPAIADRAQLRRTVARLGLLQIDSVTVLTRAHYLPLFSRLGDYPRALLDDAAWGAKPSLFEYWAHEASLLPPTTQPLLRWRMQQADRLEGIYGELRRFVTERRAHVDAVLARIRSDGGLAASDLDGPRGAGGWWGWSENKRALEWLFWAGHVTTATRRGGFERVYDLPERVLPRAVLDTPTPEPADAHRALLQIAARALGIATLGDLRDYFRLSPGEATDRVAELVEMGELVPVTVEGWKQQAYVHSAARWPRRVEACALLCPFDPAVWERTRTERLYEFRYRLEIYTPAHKRQHGYYVLPFLLGDRMVARVDLKTMRTTSTLHVLAAHAEPHASPETAERLLAELQTMARWLGLEHVAITPAGDFGPTLAAAHGNAATDIEIVPEPAPAENG
ncbi:winged helix-turn-helix domain-containing protein [Acidisphaera sp. L21]|uniref:winged helix-turn-helix domain-containing protein n=1 Tax=Acidisphaera sp. L21 TaxID=1641851 RepID=UPI00131DC907|nr:winged helix-turn-helix domain-containing protein [Acidisphaera sp. L21]